MIYSYPYTISISRSGPDNQLTPACAMDLLQDCATLHTMAAGAGPGQTETAAYRVGGQQLEHLF